MRSLQKAAAGLFFVLLTSACLVETEATLSEPDAKAMDQRLIGTWYGNNNKDEMFAFVVAADEKEPGVYRVVYLDVKPRAEKPVEYAQYRAWRTVVDGKPFLNVRKIGAGEGPALSVMTYDIGANGALTIRLMDLKAAAALVDAAKIKGKVVRKENYVDSVTLTAPRAELATFVAANRETLFTVKMGPMPKLPVTKAM